MTRDLIAQLDLTCAGQLDHLDPSSPESGPGVDSTPCGPAGLVILLPRSI